MVQGKGGVLGGNDRTLDVGVLLRADVDGIRADGACLPAHPGGGGRAEAEAICALVLPLFNFQKAKGQAGGGRARRWWAWYALSFCQSGKMLAHTIVVAELIL